MNNNQFNQPNNENNNTSFNGQPLNNQNNNMIYPNNNNLHANSNQINTNNYQTTNIMSQETNAGNNFQNINFDQNLMNDTMYSNSQNNTLEKSKGNKKILLLILLLIIIVAIIMVSVFCIGNKDDKNTGNADNNLSSDNSNQQHDNKLDSNIQEITLDIVNNYPESPESDFEIVDHGNGVVELLRYLGDDEIVVIPETVNGKAITHIASFVFANDYHPNTKAIRLSDSVEVIDMSAFGLNTSIEIFVAGTGLQEIGQAAFQNCTSLRQVILNDNLKKIEGFAFGGCTGLSEVEIPESVVELQPSIFYGVKDNVKIIGTTGSAAEQYANKEGINFQAK